jgi:UDP-2,3-diacylglucosamine pyrophosphatase LpxH
VKPTRESGNVLIIGDSHLPFEHKGYLPFLEKIRDKYSISDDNVYNAGDIVDNHAISFHQHDANGMSAGDEMKLVKERVKEWIKVFPKMKITTGNHDALSARQLAAAGIPKQYFRTLNEVYDLPEEWLFENEFWINEETKLIHGLGFSGMYPHANAAKTNMCNVIMGHIHSVAGVHWIVNERTKIYGMAVGCGIDRHKYAFEYAFTMARKPVLSCGVLLDGKTPLIEMMDI